jgi:nitrate/TMAO reductase-like tetraheme cytochrome c subunit
MTGRHCLLGLLGFAIVAGLVKPPEFSAVSTKVLRAEQSRTDVAPRPGNSKNDDTGIRSPKAIRDVEHPFDADWPAVWLIVAQKCNGCHRSNTRRTDFTSWEKLVDCKVDGQRLIVPGNAERSVLWEQVIWNHAEDPKSQEMDSPLMPPEEDEWLTAGQLKTLKRWINNGALKYKLPNTCSTQPLLEIDFPSAKECKACHPKQFGEWSRSMHAYAQHSPIFEAFNQTLQERTSGTIGTFCVRCHTPVGTSLGENGRVRNVNRSRMSMEGISCVVCHRLERNYYKASTRRAIKPGALVDNCMFGPFSDSVSLSEGAHQSKKSVSIRSSAFCGACHDVTSPEGVRLEEAFSEWQNSPAAKQGTTCQHCHMGPEQGIAYKEDERPLGRAARVPGIDKSMIPVRPLSDHTFAGPDYSILPDTEFPEKLDWMYETDYRQTHKLTSHQKQTLTELRKRNRRHLKIARQKRYELLRNGAELGTIEVPNDAKVGKQIKIGVTVRSKFPGHNFPTGFTEERQLWISITVRDPVGRVVFRSGHFDHNGDLRDEHSHDVESGKLAWDRHLVNFQSKFVSTVNRGTERSVVLSVNRDLSPLNIFRPVNEPAAAFGHPMAFRIAKGSLPPLSKIRKSYPVKLSQTPGRYAINVKLNYRHIPPVLMDKIGIPHLKHLLETVVIDQCDTTLQVRSGGLFGR